MKVGIASSLMMCIECWSYEILALVAAFIGTNAVGCMAVLINTSTVLYMYAIGSSIATTVLVGKAMGERNINKAKRTSVVAAIYNFCGLLLINLTLIIFSGNIASLFSNEDDLF